MARHEPYVYRRKENNVSDAAPHYIHFIVMKMLVCNKRLPKLQSMDHKFPGITNQKHTDNNLAILQRK